MSSTCLCDAWATFGQLACSGPLLTPWAPGSSDTGAWSPRLLAYATSPEVRSPTTRLKPLNACRREVLDIGRAHSSCCSEAMTRQESAAPARTCRSIAPTYSGGDRSLIRNWTGKSPRDLASLTRSKSTCASHQRPQLWLTGASSHIWCALPLRAKSTPLGSWSRTRSVLAS